jgi:hypothetical protein
MPRLLMVEGPLTARSLNMGTGRCLANAFFAAAAAPAPTTAISSLASHLSSSARCKPPPLSFTALQARKIVLSVVAPSQLPPFLVLSDGDSVRARTRRVAIHHQIIGKLPLSLLFGDTPEPGPVRACGPLSNCTMKPCDRQGGWRRRGGKLGWTTSSLLPLSLFEWQLSEVKGRLPKVGQVFGWRCCRGLSFQSHLPRLHPPC